MDYLIGAVIGVSAFVFVCWLIFSNQPGGIDAMRGALTMWIMAELGDEAAEAHRLIEALQFPLEKPPAHLSIYDRALRFDDRALRFDDRALCFDDRALHFNGSWPSPGLLLAFKPWNKREPQPETPVIDNKPELSACCAAIDALLDTALERGVPSPIWPLPSIHDWCGEHQPREAAQ